MDSHHSACYFFVLLVLMVCKSRKVRRLSLSLWLLLRDEEPEPSPLACTDSPMSLRCYFSFSFFRFFFHYSQMALSGKVSALEGMQASCRLVKWKYIGGKYSIAYLVAAHVNWGVLLV